MGKDKIEKRGQHKCSVLSGVERDIIATDKNKNLTCVCIDNIEAEKLNLMDEIESQLEMVGGTLDFAIDSSTNNKGFYIGLNHHIKNITAMLDKLRK